VKTVASVALWPTKINAYFMEDAAEHNQRLTELVLSLEPDVPPVGEMKVYDLETTGHDSVKWLLSRVEIAVQEYLGEPAKCTIKLRAVVLRAGGHISTHTESAESDVGVAYWPSGIEGDDTEINSNGDAINQPTFILEDPSRSISDLRLPFEDRHSVCLRPRPGLMAVFPAHMPHNMHPYMGEKPFVHIVAQVRVDWSEDYLRRY
jgi:hypothetical protein